MTDDEKYQLVKSCMEIDVTSPSGLRWTRKINKNVTVGAPAIRCFCKRRKYYVGRVEGNNMLAHVVVWALHNGRWPKPGMKIDHSDGISTNNNPLNLREVTHGVNMQNTVKRRGYSWCNKTHKWQVRIAVDKKRIDVGRYDTELDARAAYLSAKREYHKEATCF